MNNQASTRSNTPNENGNAEDRIVSDPDFQRLVEDSPFACVVVDEALKYVYMNPAAEEALGLSLQEAKGRPLAGLFAKEKEALNEALRTGRSLEIEDFAPGTSGGHRRATLRVTRLERGLGLAWAQDGSERGSALRLEAAEAELDSLAAHLIQVREQERKLMAREMHDELGQAFTAMELLIERARRRCGRSPDEAVAALTEALELSSKTGEAVRRMASELRPSLLDNLGLKPALEWYVAEFSRNSGLRARLDFELRREPAEENVSTALFRITQESLTNAARHAWASSVRVSLREEAGSAILEVEDDGVGIPSELATSSSSYGIMGMRERARELGGGLSLRRGAASGTIVRASIPMAPARSRS
jgi:PAS domain S-box